MKIYLGRIVFFPNMKKKTLLFEKKQKDDIGKPKYKPVDYSLLLQLQPHSEVLTKLSEVPNTEAYSQLSQTYKMELFAKTVNGF